jgi:hypothetical protein
MKTFKDIDFKPHSVGQGLQGKIFFDNGYGVSVVRFKIGERYSSYTNNEDEWELAVLFGNEKEWELTYNTPITNDVIGWLSSEDVTEIMRKVQGLNG